MIRQILVPLKSHDRVQEIIPILQKIAKPGMRVTFLVPYPVDPWVWFLDQWRAGGSTAAVVWESRKILGPYCPDGQKRLAERRISLAREALSKMGVEIALMLKRCLRSAVRDCIRSGEFQLILMSAGNGHAMMGLVQLMMFLFRRIKRPKFSSFLLYNPQPVAHHGKSTPLLYTDESRRASVQ